MFYYNVTESATYTVVSILAWIPIGQEDRAVKLHPQDWTCNVKSDL